jgi:4-hydroxy-2-oxoheptanedioate aldolase
LPAPERQLAARLGAKETLCGLLVKMPSPATVELAGHCGFDFVVLDTEHGAADTGDLEHHVRAADSVGVPLLVRIGSSEPVETLRALDAGATGIVVPHVNSAAEARDVVRAAHYPPMGTRGFAVSTRAGHHGRRTVAEHARVALEETVVVVQVEDAKALGHVAEIASVERVDAIFLGPNDLSVSLGRPGELSHPEVAAAVDGIVKDVGRAKGAAHGWRADRRRVARGRRSACRRAWRPAATLTRSTAGTTRNRTLGPRRRAGGIG